MSDLHYSTTNKRELDYIREAILSDVDNFLRKNNLMPNFIIFSGDLVSKPNDELEKIDIFNEAYEFFITPLLEKLNLTKDDIFITPGNHDLNRTIINRRDEKGLLSYLEDKSLPNELITDIINKKQDLKYLEQFNNFINNLGNKNEIYSNDIFRVYEQNLGKIKIGIVNLNSNILALNNDTYGKLIIGESQLKEAFEKIKTHDIKIANIHHSVNWLVNFEQLLVKKFYYKNFNLVFIGHEHTEYPELINFNDEDTLILNSASIFQGRKDINGYSIFDYSFNNTSAKIYVREYDARNYKFSTLSFKEPLTSYTHSFNILKKMSNKKNIELILDEMREPLQKIIQQELLINTAKKENNSIEDIFIEPNIYDESEFKESKNQDKKQYTIRDIINIKKHIVIKGIEASGKTTLLNYIANEYLKMNSAEHKIPILLNKLDIKEPLTETILIEKTLTYLRKLKLNTSHSILNDLLREGSIVYLIDNISENQHCIRFIEDISKNKRFTNNKFIFSIKEEIFNSIDNKENKLTDSVDILELYVYNLKRSKAREFFYLYFNKQELKHEEFENIFHFISKLNIPLTIFNYTIIALTYENQRENFKPVNEAFLLDIFMENLLEKLDVLNNMNIGSLGYNLKADYLIYIAKWMVENQTFSIEKYLLISLTSNFIHELKREKENINIESFVEYMEAKGIFVNTDSTQYRFRYRAFLEFFIAKGMLKDEHLKEKIIHKDSYLDYKNEISYYCGLHGEDEKVINHFQQLLNKYDDFFTTIKPNDGSIITIPELNLDEKDKIIVKQISSDKKDKILEQKSKNITTDNDIKKIDSSIDKDKFKEKIIFETNLLLARILRNSEQLKNPELKIAILNLVTSNLSKFFQYFINQNKELEEIILQDFDNFKNDDETLKNISDKDIKHFIALLNIVISQSFMKIMQNNISSESLFTAYSEILDETQDDLLKLFICSTFIYSDNSDALHSIEKLINNQTFSKNRFLMMTLFFKIFHSIKFMEIDNKNKNILEDFLNQIIIKLKYNTIKLSGTHQGSRKNNIIGQNKKLIKDKIQQDLKKN